MAFSIAGTTLSSYPMTPGKTSRPSASLARRFARSSCLTLRGRQPDAFHSPSVRAGGGAGLAAALALGRVYFLGEYRRKVAIYQGLPIKIDNHPFYRLAQTRSLVVVPFFISDGLHTRQDIPVQLGESPPVVAQRLGSGQPTWRNPTEKHGKLVWYSPAVGTEPRLADVILERVREACRSRGDETQTE